MPIPKTKTKNNFIIRNLFRFKRTRITTVITKVEKTKIREFKIEPDTVFPAGWYDGSDWYNPRKLLVKNNEANCTTRTKMWMDKISFIGKILRKLDIFNIEKY